jgi:hypothetical protein
MMVHLDDKWLSVSYSTSYSRESHWLERVEPTAYPHTLSAEFALGGLR